MAERVDLRAELAVGRHTHDPGRVLVIAEWIDGRPRRLPRLVELLWDEDQGVACRAADVLERITRSPSKALKTAVARYKVELIGLLSDATFPKVRWNLALTLPRLELTVPECRRIAAALKTWLDDSSSIVKTAALNGLAELTRQDSDSLPEVVDLLRLKGRSGTPAMRARSRILLNKLERGMGARREHGGLHMFD
jgi:HEAT repeat protein